MQGSVYILHRKVISKLVARGTIYLMSGALLLSMVAAPAIAVLAAKNSVNSRAIIDHTIRSRDIRNGAVTTDRIAMRAIRRGKIAIGAVRSYHIKDGAVTTAKIFDGTIVNADISILAAISASKINRTGLDADLLDGYHASAFILNSLPNPNQVALLRWYEAAQADTSFTVGTEPIGVAFDGANIWVANSLDDNVSKL